jgi:hypothetical protein
LFSLLFVDMVALAPSSKSSVYEQFGAGGEKKYDELQSYADSERREDEAGGVQE